ncbi:hypothetical protein PQQ86_06695 [Paraburkholderia sediminicola]|uniref:hypothetical protein n=1 Tax=Paraburkholderia sediminicola TaxID=458836 RepID=UPI0038B9B74E
MTFDWRNFLQTSLAFLSAGTFATFPACAADSGGTAQELRVGFVPGPYADEFKAGVEPQCTSDAGHRRGVSVV